VLFLVKELAFELALVVALADREVQVLLVTVADATTLLALHGGVVQLAAAAVLAGHVAVVSALQGDAHFIYFLLVEVFNLISTTIHTIYLLCK
jgi:hypothetical protein